MFLTLFFLASSIQLSTQHEEIDLQRGQRSRFELRYRPVSQVTGQAGSLGGELLTLPRTGPVPTYRDSKFSTMYRARDVADVDRYPARAVVKLYRLEADGRRATEACTAQFIGPRHLLTAGHCIADLSTGIPHAGFEVAIRYDAARARGGVAKVTRAWMVADEMRLTRPEDALVMPERCNDLATLEIAEPIGGEVGWLGMRDLAPAPAASNNVVLHRFAYPHVPSTASLQRSAATAPAEARQEIEAQISAARLTEPDFSPDNMYYEFGRADEAKGNYIAHRTPYSAPGRSGSALIDDQANIVALASRGYAGTFYSCRLTAADIGAVRALIARAGR